MGARGCEPGTGVHGMPKVGSEPKSGWRLVEAPMLAMYASERGSTGSPETSRFHGLSAGNTAHPMITGGPLAAALGAGPGVVVVVLLAEPPPPHMASAAAARAIAAGVALPLPPPYPMASARGRPHARFARIYNPGTHHAHRPTHVPRRAGRKPRRACPAARGRAREAVPHRVLDPRLPGLELGHRPRPGGPSRLFRDRAAR